MCVCVCVWIKMQCMYCMIRLIIVSECVHNEFPNSFLIVIHKRERNQYFLQKLKSLYFMG